MAVQFNKDRTVNWKSYFPVRNGVKPESFLVEGRNYTNETLYYMSKARIARTIADKVEYYLNDSPYVLIDICAGIGGNTLEFLSRKNSTVVISFERDPVRRLMLQRNISGYKLDDKSIVAYGSDFKDKIEISGEEDFTDYKDAVFYMDPPWLPENLKVAGTDYKSQYILKDMKVGNLSLENWLRKLADTAYLVVYRLPPNYILDSVPGWTYVVDELGNDGRMITCIPNRNIKGYNTEEFGGVIYTQTETGDSVKALTTLMMKLKSIDTATAKKYKDFRTSCNALSFEKAVKEDKCKIFVKWGFTDPEPYKPAAEKALFGRVSGEGVQLKKEEFVVKEPVKITKPTSPTFPTGDDVPESEQVYTFTDIPVPTKGLDLESAEWVSEFQNYIGYVLSKFIKDKEAVNNLLTQDAMPVWIQAFTTKSYKPDSTENYEILEKLGDAVFKYTFTRHLIKKFGNEVNPNFLTNYTKIYLSEKYQPYLAKSLGFEPWIRRDFTIADLKALEDVSESFVGALEMIGNKIRGIGYGVYLCQAFVDFIAKPLRYRKELLQGEEIQRIGQRLEIALGSIGKGSIEEIYTGASPNIKGQLLLKPEAAEKLIEWGFPIRDDRVIGIGIGDTKAKAKYNAFVDADKKFSSMGFTNEYAESKKLEKSWKDIEDLDPKTYKFAKAKLQRAGYSNNEVEFIQERKANTYYVILVGKDDKGKDKRLGVGSNANLVNAKIIALKDYIENF